MGLFFFMEHETRFEPGDSGLARIAKRSTKADRRDPHVGNALRWLKSLRFTRRSCAEVPHGHLGRRLAKSRGVRVERLDRFKLSSTEGITPVMVNRFLKHFTQSSALVLVLATQAIAVEDVEALAKQAQNPISDLITVPIEENFSFGGPGRRDSARGQRVTGLPSQAERGFASHQSRHHPPRRVPAVVGNRGRRRIRHRRHQLHIIHFATEVAW